MTETRLNELSLTEGVKLIQSGSIRPRDLVLDCVNKIERFQEELGAFTTVDRNQIIRDVEALENQQNNLPLYGIPVGVKDIMDTAGMKTTMGSPIYRDYVPHRDAACVSMLKSAGAVVAGKTETTEFAYYYPGKTRNPHAKDHTPGGSSMGSAVAVSEMMVPLALGTQTAGSVIRPAAYCGVVGYKASHGAFSLAGIFGFAQSLDSLGFFVRKVSDLSIIRNALLGSSLEAMPIPKSLRIGLVRTPHWDMAEPSQRQLLEDICECLQNQQIEISEIEVGPSDGALTQAQITIMAYEGCRSLGTEYEKYPQLLSEQIKALIELGHNTTFESYQQAIELTRVWQKNLRKIFREKDVLITPSAPGEAPKGLDSTGDPIFNRVWTLLKVPCLHLPVGFGPNGLPLGIQLVGQFNQDDRLINIASQLKVLLAAFELKPN